MSIGKLLGSFARHGVVLEGAGQALAAATVAVVLSAAAASPANALPKPKGPHARAPFERTYSGKPLANYSSLIADVQHQVDAAGFPVPIIIVDRTKDPRSQAARLGAATGVPKDIRIDPAPLRGPAHSNFFHGGPGRVACFVVGADPSAGVADIVGHGLEPGYRAGTTSQEDIHKLVLWHEVGHCLLGASEAKADAFGTLKFLADGGNRQAVEFVTAGRELNEWTGMPSDPHFTSAALRTVLRETAEKAPSGSLLDLAMTANAIPEPAIERQAKIRRALFEAKRYEDQAFLVPVREGFVATSENEWLRASSTVPELAHIAELKDYMRADPATRQLPAELRPDPHASAIAVAALANAGDPIMREIAPAFDASRPAANAAIETPSGLLSGDQIKGQLFAFDRTDAVVKFTQDGERFLVTEKGTNRRVAAGNAHDGITATFGHPEASAAYSGPRR